MNSIHIGIIQLDNAVDTVKQRLLHIEKIIKEVCNQKVDLIVLPELSTSGYIPNKHVWEYGEIGNGVTKQWAKTLAKELGVHIACGFLESDGNDFYNAYLIANPMGEIDGVVTKIVAESYCFKSKDSSVVINTSLGKIGVGICADSHKIEFFDRIRKAEVDLLLLPHAWQTAYKESKVVKQKDIESDKQALIEFPKVFSEYLNIPTVFVNAVGNVENMPGVLGRFMSPDIYKLQGTSTILDKQGNSLVLLDDQESFAVREVVLEKGKLTKLFEGYDGYVIKGSKIARKFMIPFDVRKGKHYYEKNNQRKQLAQKNLVI